MGLQYFADRNDLWSSDRKKRVQKMLNEASRLLQQTIHSTSRVVEVWDRFNDQDAAYLSGILLKRNEKQAGVVPPVGVVNEIRHHINDLRDLQRRAKEQQDLCSGLAREVCQTFLPGSKD